MKIILFAHPDFLGSQSMPRYANMLLQGMRERGHNVEVWTPKARFSSLPVPASLRKWMGYMDQYLVFPIEVKLKLHNCSKDSLFVFADQALGPWVSMVRNRPHIVHCHDFLALKSALGRIPENPTSLSGKIYQNYIRNGFSKGKHFICISQKTQHDLRKLHCGEIQSSVVCYNGLNKPFLPLDLNASRALMAKKLNVELTSGYILHIGGNQYYKNRRGVLEIYEVWRKVSTNTLPLLMIGSHPTSELKAIHQSSVFKKDIHFITGLADEFINRAYSGASCLLFPSLAEGFGWPIAEAMASGCLVITTKEAPMTEVGGTAAFYIAKRPSCNDIEIQFWKESSSKVLDNVVSLSGVERELAIGKSIFQAKMFDTTVALDAIEKSYKEILEYK